MTADHPLEPLFGDLCPLGRLYDLDAKVLFLGTGYETCTCLHLAEYRTSASKRYLNEGTTCLVDGQRTRVPFTMQSLDTDDFTTIGAAFEARGLVRSGPVGLATAKLLPLRPLVDFAVAWMDTHRPKVDVLPLHK